MVQFEGPRHSNPCVSLRLGELYFPIFSLPLSGIIRIGLPSIKMQKLENLGNTIGLTGCKGSSLNVPGTETPVSRSGWESSVFPFQPSSLWDNKNWAPQYKDVEAGKFSEQNWLNRLQMVQFEGPKVRNPLVLPFLGFQQHLSHSYVSESEPHFTLRRAAMPFVERNVSLNI